MERVDTLETTTLDPALTEEAFRAKDQQCMAGLGLRRLLQLFLRLQS